jgi:formylmethanofuran dehydrogenase subunit E-like metal-binding protein
MALSISLSLSLCVFDSFSLGGYIVNQVVTLFFFQDHRETDLFLTSSGVHLEQTNFHFRRAAFFSHLKSKVGNILAKAAALSDGLS